jgi:hypothetical protein
LELNQHTVCALPNLEYKLRGALVGRIKGELGITTERYYKSKSKQAVDRRNFNKSQIDGFAASLRREIDAACYDVPSHEDFVVAVNIDYDVDKSGLIKRFGAYSFDLHPPAVSSNGKGFAKKKSRIIVVVGEDAKQAYEKTVTECANEFALKPFYYSNRELVPSELKRLIEKETGVLVLDTFYSFLTERRGNQQLTFRSTKDMRKAIMHALDPDFALVDDSWRCSFTEMTKIQRSVSTLQDWGVTRLDMTKPLDKKMTQARRDFQTAISGLQQSPRYEQPKTKLERIQTKFNEIDRQYKDAKAVWQKAEGRRATRYGDYSSTKTECISRIEECGHRLELEVLPQLEDLLRKDQHVGRLPEIKEGLNRLAGMIDWAQRITFLLSMFASVTLHP